MFPFLPNELVVKILDVLASSDRKSCLALCLVSSWTRRIALPHLLHSLRHRLGAELYGFLVNTRHTSYVKRMWMGAWCRNAGSILTSLTHLCITHSSLLGADFIKRIFIVPQLARFAGAVDSVDDLEFLGAYGARLAMVVAMADDVQDEDVVAWAREVETRVYLTGLDNLGLERDWRQGGRPMRWIWVSFQIYKENWKLVHSTRWYERRFIKCGRILNAWDRIAFLDKFPAIPVPHPSVHHSLPLDDSDVELITRVFLPPARSFYDSRGQSLVGLVKEARKSEKRMCIVPLGLDGGCDREGECMEQGEEIDAKLVWFECKRR